MQPVPASVWTLIAGMIISLISLWVGQHHGVLPEQASEQVPLVDGFFSVMVTIATTLFLIVQGAILLFVIQFRRRPGDDTDWVPQFRMKQDAIPGQPAEMRFTATKLGTYPIGCTELCGSYHGSMRTQLIVETAAAFAAWQAENQVAQQSEATKVIAVYPAGPSNSAFLAPYGHEMGVDAAILGQLHL